MNLTPVDPLPHPPRSQPKPPPVEATIASAATIRDALSSQTAAWPRHGQATAQQQAERIAVSTGESGRAPAASVPTPPPPPPATGKPAGALALLLRSLASFFTATATPEVASPPRAPERGDAPTASERQAMPQAMPAQPRDAQALPGAVPACGAPSSGTEAAPRPTAVVGCESGHAAPRAELVPPPNGLQPDRDPIPLLQQAIVATCVAALVVVLLSVL